MIPPEKKCCQGSRSHCCQPEQHCAELGAFIHLKGRDKKTIVEKIKEHCCQKRKKDWTTMSISSWTQGNHLCWRAASPRQQSWCHIGSGARVKIDTRSHRCAFIWGLRQRQWFKLLEDTWKVCTGGASVCEELRDAHICEHLWLPAAAASWSPLIWFYFSSYFCKDPSELKLRYIEFKSVNWAIFYKWGFQWEALSREVLRKIVVQWFTTRGFLLKCFQL